MNLKAQNQVKQLGAVPKGSNVASRANNSSSQLVQFDRSELENLSKKDIVIDPPITDKTREVLDNAGNYMVEGGSSVSSILSDLSKRVVSNQGKPIYEDYNSFKHAGLMAMCAGLGLYGVKSLIDIVRLPFNSAATLKTYALSGLKTFLAGASFTGIYNGITSNGKSKFTKPNHIAAAIAGLWGLNAGEKISLGDQNNLVARVLKTFNISNFQSKIGETQNV